MAGRAERPHGEWIEVEKIQTSIPISKDDKPSFEYRLRCSECGFTKNFLDGHTAQYNFCPNCGADMRGEDSPFE